MKHLKIALLSISLIGCHPNMEKERKKNAPHLVEADRIVLACVKYHTQYGKYPDRLGDLEPVFWLHAKRDIRKNSNIVIRYNSNLANDNGQLSLQIGSVLYVYDFKEWQKGWQESDQSF